MANIIPMVSSSPPPMDAGDGFDWDDDDDGFGTFTGADDSVTFPQVKQFSNDDSGIEKINDMTGQTNSDVNQSSSIGQCGGSDHGSGVANFATFPSDTDSVNPTDADVSATEADARPNSINLPEETNNLDKVNSENSKSEKCLTCDTNGILTDSGMYSSDVSPVPQIENVDSVDDISADFPNVEHVDTNQSDASKSFLKSNEKVDNNENENDPVSVRGPEDEHESVDSIDKTNEVSKGFDPGESGDKQLKTSDSNSFNCKESESSRKNEVCSERNEDSISTTETKLSTNGDETLVEPESNVTVFEPESNVTMSELESNVTVSVCQNDSLREECISGTPCDNVDSQSNIPTQETPSHSQCNNIDNIENTTIDKDIKNITVDVDIEDTTMDECSTQHVNSSQETGDAQGNVENVSNDGPKDSECDDDWDAFATVTHESNDSSNKACVDQDHISLNTANGSETNIELHDVQKDGDGDSSEVETPTSCAIPPDQVTVAENFSVDTGDTNGDSTIPADQVTVADSRVDTGDTDGDSEDATKTDALHGDDLQNVGKFTGGACAISVDDNDEIIKDDLKPSDQSLTVSDDESRKDVDENTDCDSHLKGNEDDHQCSNDQTEQVCTSPKEHEDVDKSGSDLNNVESDDFGDLNNEDDGFADFDEYKATEQGNVEHLDTSVGSFAAFGSGNDQEETDDWAGFSEPALSNKLEEAREGTNDSWAAFSEPQVASVSQDITDDGDDEWAGFEDESTEFCSQDTSSHQPDTKPAIEKQPVLPALQNMSKQEKVMYAVTTCFPEILSDLEAEVTDIDSLVSVTEATHREASIWLQIRGLQTTNALSYQWSRSHWNNQLFSTLQVDTRNILVGHKKAQVPIFASGLTLLEPVKGQGSPLKPDVLVDTTSKVDSLATTQPQEAIPPAQFDWHSSGLTNPLEANKTLTLDFIIQDQATKSNALESEFLATESPTHKPAIQPLENILANLKGTPTFKPTNQHEDVSSAAHKVVDKLPNLSFMKSKVLMFPIKMD